MHILLLEVLILFRNHDTFLCSRSASTCLYRFNVPICCLILLIGAASVPRYRCGYRLLCMASASLGPLRPFAAVAEVVDDARAARDTPAFADANVVAIARGWNCGCALDSESLKLMGMVPKISRRDD